MVSKCDKPLEPLSTCPTYSNSFYPLQLFLPFHMYPNLPIHKNILHPYFVSNQLTFHPSQCPLVSANVINHSSLSAHVLHISFPLYYIFRSEKERKEGKERERRE